MKYRGQIHNLYLRFKYFGFKFKCPFCKGSFRKFLPFGSVTPVLKEKKVVGGGYRLNTRCPVCNSIDRERLVYLYLKNKTDIFHKNCKVLHIAPEKELQKVLMKHSNIDYLSADINSPLATAKIDILDINYGDNFFDIIICNHVLEHITNDYRAMSELYRVLKPGGWAILQVPISLLLVSTYEDLNITSPFERKRTFGEASHVRIYAKDYKERLEKTGFSVRVYNFAEEFSASLAYKYGLCREENLYICSNPEYNKRKA